MNHRTGALPILTAIGWDGDWEWLRDCEAHAQADGRTLVDELGRYHDGMFAHRIERGVVEPFTPREVLAGLQVEADREVAARLEPGFKAQA